MPGTACALGPGVYNLRTYCDTTLDMSYVKGTASDVSCFPSSTLEYVISSLKRAAQCSSARIHESHIGNRSQAPEKLTKRTKGHSRKAGIKKMEFFYCTDIFTKVPNLAAWEVCVLKL